MTEFDWALVFQAADQTTERAILLLPVDTSDGVVELAEQIYPETEVVRVGTRIVFTDGYVHPPKKPPIKPLSMNDLIAEDDIREMSHAEYTQARERLYEMQSRRALRPTRPIKGKFYPLGQQRYIWPHDD